MSKLGVPVVRDLSRKLRDRVEREIMSTAMLADDERERFNIAVGALATSVAVVGAFFSSIDGKYQDPFDVGIALLRELQDAATRRADLNVDEVKARLGEDR